MFFIQIRRYAPVLIVMTLLLAACARSVEPETVAYQFVQFYFVEDNLAAAVKLSSGSARAKLEKDLQEIAAAGVKEPGTGKPLVKAALLETRPVSRDEMLYIYRVASDVEVAGMKPITARLWLGKEGTVWHVSKFTQEE
jgi:hypothetical protein